MKIIIVGIGKVGYAIAEQMTGENHDLVVIDRNSAVLDHVDSMLDVMCVEGNGASASVLLEAACARRTFSSPFRKMTRSTSSAA